MSLHWLRQKSFPVRYALAAAAGEAGASAKVAATRTSAVPPRTSRLVWEPVDMGSVPSRRRGAKPFRVYRTVTFTNLDVKGEIDVRQDRSRPLRVGPADR